jgi:hypothetical protein
MSVTYPIKGYDVQEWRTWESWTEGAMDPSRTSSWVSVNQVPFPTVAAALFHIGKTYGEHFLPHVRIVPVMVTMGWPEPF